jgi:Tol biopolymer transport system component
MSVSTGSTLGAYTILAPIGSGAMGEVWRARDTRLGREVAIKVLPEHFADDEERLKRFEREAKTLATLNHPNVAQIFGVDQIGDTCFLVLELVPGESLEERLARGPLPLDEALETCRQIAEGLEAAHESGVIHRDLKPANIRLTPDGKVKVLDFGLAKPMAVSGETRATDSVLSTEAGRLLGTPTYMAPEQARGKTIDRRIDVWAFGCVLYECLTAKRAFDGETLSDVLSSVLRSDVELDGLPAATPASVRELLRRCLTKEPRQRLRDIGDARLVLERADLVAERASIVGRASPRGRALPWSLCALLALLLALVSFQAFGGRSPVAAPVLPRGAVHASLGLPAGDEVGMVNEMPLAISPDGAHVVYVGQRDERTQLYLRPLGVAEPTPIAGTASAKSPFFSPDGRWVGFFANDKLKRVTIGGTALQVLADAPAARGGCWGTDDALYFAPTNVSSIWKVPAAGGTATEVTRVDRASGEISHRWPQLLPDGKTLLFSVWTGPGSDERQIVRQTLGADGAHHVLLPGGDAPRFSSSGHLAFGSMDELFALPWTPAELGLEGRVPIALPERPRLDGEGASAFALSTTGTLVYLRGDPARRALRVVWVDRDGAVEPLPLPERDYHSVAISPDGSQAIVQIEEGTVGLWLHDFARRTLTPFATGAGSSQAPLWSPDGERVFYRGTRAGFRNLYSKAADGTGEEERLTAKADVVQTPTSVSPDGKWLVFNEEGGGSSDRVWCLPLGDEADAGADARILAEGSDGQIAPDGEWIAYQSLVSGRFEIYLQPFPGPGPRQPVSTGGGRWPRWSRDGRELYFTTADALLAAEITTAPELSIGAPRVLFEGRYRDSVNYNTPYDVSADGRFLRVQQVQPELAVTRIEVVLDWAAELEQAAR